MSLRKLSVVSALLIAGIAHAQSSTDVLARILERASEVQGRDHKPTSIRLTGYLTSPGSTGRRSFEMIAAAPNRYLTRIAGDNYSYSYVRNGRRVAAVLNGREMPISPLTGRNDRCPYLPLFGHFEDIASNRFAALAATSSRSSSGDPLDVILFTSLDRIPERIATKFQNQLTGKLAINQSTSLPESLEVMSFHPMNPTHNTSTEYRYSDYRRSERIMIPRRIEIATNRQSDSVIVIEAVEMNVAVPSELGVEVQ